ncbi:MAG: glycosyltransferase family A protein [Ferruginibacter sp.]
MKTKPLLSVICVSMNHEKFIERSFTSLINQTFRDFEILYVDNNSGDNSFEIADNLFKNSEISYKGFRRVENYSLSANVNFLLQLAQGEYIAALSGDDFLELTNFEEKMNYYSKHPEFGMIYGTGYKYYYDTGETELMDSSKCKSGWIFKDLLSGNFINAIGFIVKKATLDDVGHFDENSLIEDWDLWIRIAEKYPIGFFNKPLIYYGRTGSNISDDITYMDKGADYIFEKYGHHDQMNEAKKNYKLYRVYQYASENPSWKNFKFIIKNFQFNVAYFKQVFKFCINSLGFKKHIKNNQ